MLSILLLSLLKITSAGENKDADAPMVYVERCSFLFEGDNCGAIAKNVIYFSSEEFLSYTDDWAVGRKGQYKLYMSCLDPEEGAIINGTQSLITIVVAGPGLGKAHDIAKQLIAEFSSELPENSGNIAHCIMR